MIKRRKHDWLQLFSDFERSDQTQSEFCKQRGINPNYFSLKLSKYKTASPPSAFTRVAVESLNERAQSLIIEIGNCKIHCPVTLPAESFAALVRSLA